MLCVEFCNFVQCDVFVSTYLFIVKYDTTVVSWYDNGIILKPKFHFMVYLSKLF
jgi:hypothetical protein